MKVQSHQTGAVTVLELSGRFDKHVAPIVTHELERATTLPSAQIVVNLADVGFVDSTALAVLVQAMKRCRQRGGELYLCGMNPKVFMIFELTRLDKAFSIFSDEDHAIEAFSG